MNKSYQPAVTMECYRQMIYECGAMLMSDGCNKQDIIHRLMALADRPVENMPDNITRPIRTMPPSCDSCRKYTPDFQKNAMVCEAGHADCKTCGEYDSRYMTFPLEINGIDITKMPDSKNTRPAELVKVRLAGDDKTTYLGWLLNDIGSDFSLSYDKKSKLLHAFVYSNPPIFVPALGRIVYGYESWWQRIKDESDLSDITDTDIDNVWYVKAWRALQEQIAPNSEHSHF